MPTAAAPQSPASEPPSGDIEADPGLARTARHDSRVRLHRTRTREGLTVTSQLHPFWRTKKGWFLVFLIGAVIVGVIVGGVIGGRHDRGGNGPRSETTTTRQASASATASEATTASSVAGSSSASLATTHSAATTAVTTALA